MHVRQDPEDAGVTSDPFGYNKVNVGWTKFKATKLGWNGFNGCQFVSGIFFAMLMFFLCVFEFSVVYRYVVNSREVADAMSSIANLCM